MYDELTLHIAHDLLVPSLQSRVSRVESSQSSEQGSGGQVEESSSESSEPSRAVSRNFPYLHSDILEYRYIHVDLLHAASSTT